MKKRGQGMMGSRKMISFGLGFIMLILGAIPLFYTFGFIGFTIPTIPMMVLYVLAVIGGILLFWDGLSESQGMGMARMVMFASYALALASLAMGIVPLLGPEGAGVISFSFGEIATVIIYILFMLDGLLLIFGGTQGFP